MTAAAPRPVVDDAGRRNRDLARIHVLKKELRLDDDAYRDLLHAIARVGSAAALDWTGRQRVLAHLARLKKAMGVKEPSTVKQQRLVRWLWHRLVELGELRAEADAERERALQAFVKRQTGVEQLAWVKPRQFIGLIENLKAWVGRAEHQRRIEQEIAQGLHAEAIERFCRNRNRHRAPPKETA